MDSTGRGLSARTSEQARSRRGGGGGLLGLRRHLRRILQRAAPEEATTTHTSRRNPRRPCSACKPYVTAPKPAPPEVPAITVRPEHWCSEYDRKDYRYSQSLAEYERLVNEYAQWEQAQGC